MVKLYCESMALQEVDVALSICVGKLRMVSLLLRNGHGAAEVEGLLLVVGVDFDVLYLELDHWQLS